MYFDSCKAPLSSIDKWFLKMQLGVRYLLWLNRRVVTWSRSECSRQLVWIISSREVQHTYIIWYLFMLTSDVFGSFTTNPTICTVHPSSRLVDGYTVESQAEFVER